MKWSSTGVAATGTTEIAVDGAVPTNLVGVTAGNPKWYTASQLIFQYEVSPAVFGLGRLTPPSGAIVNIDSIGQNALGAGNSIYAAYLSGTGVRSNNGVGPWPLASLADVDDDGTVVIVTTQSTGTGLQAFDNTGVQTWATAVPLANANVRIRSDVVAYEDSTGWQLRRASTGAIVPLARRTDTVTLMIPVVLGTAVYVVEFTSAVGLSVRSATGSVGYVIPATTSSMFNPDAIGVGTTTVRIGGCVNSGEAPDELRAFDINIANGAFRSGVTTSGALVWTNGSPLALTTFSTSGGSAAAIDAISGVYQHPVIDKSHGRMTIPWYQALLRVATAVSTPIDLGSAQVTGILPEQHGGTDTTTGLTQIQISALSFSDESLLLGRGEGAGAGEGQEISLGPGLAMTGTVLDTIGSAGECYIPMTTGAIPGEILFIGGDVMLAKVPVT